MIVNKTFQPPQLFSPHFFALCFYINIAHKKLLKITTMSMYISLFHWRFNFVNQTNAPFYEWNFYGCQTEHVVKEKWCIKLQKKEKNNHMQQQYLFQRKEWKRKTKQKSLIFPLLSINTEIRLWSWANEISLKSQPSHPQPHILLH